VSASADLDAPFRNEPALELRRASQREALGGALTELDQRLPISVPAWVGDERREDSDFASSDPGRPDRLVGVAAEATSGEIDEALDAAAQAGREWSERPAPERARVLLGAAEELRRRRLELAALEVRECAKPWAEADADVCEAIDYLVYYAREALRLAAGPSLDQAPGERNTMRYVPRGVAAVIPPWNFPLAIPAGMTAAALATGNAVVLKPAEQAPATALALVEALRAAGVPPAALSLLPGYGAAGAALVRDPRVHVIAFTGSSAVGLEIIRVAAETQTGQGHVKRVIAEMGGKNCAIVDADADLDEAVPAIGASAFAYAGQKCSAISRVLAHDAICDALAERLAGAVELLRVGQAEDLATEVPPLIEDDARARVAGYIEQAERDGRIIARAEAPEGPGWFCPPTVAAGIAPSSPILRDEVFGPLLTIEPVASVDAACDVVDELPFALTGALFSRNPATVEAVANRSPVGNLYVNRRATGAMVGRQPFGGNRLSGVGSKAGGPDYLLQFTDPRVIAENTTRHGLLVE
jgi:RHH-type transcriptional regulator, proline utilization regulon repressor / proline dehydrogenase / delta 1-pyrroline-5-carboxylate dehydrogenase